LQEYAQIPIIKNWNGAKIEPKDYILNFIFLVLQIKKSDRVVFLNSMPNKFLLFVLLQK